MNYRPTNFDVWDAWCMVKGGEVHAYYLQWPRSNEPEIREKGEWLGHAVSTNLVDWRDCGPCFGPDASNPIDNAQPWTGCTLWHNGRGYLYYTMRRNDPTLNVQHIGLATSDDGFAWTRHAGNPIIVADERWYATAHRPTANILDCRDLLVIKHPTRAGWLGYFATRQVAEELPETSVIACAYSEDLMSWTQMPPVFVPNRYACVEVPDVFEMDGRWYMTCLTGQFYGNRGIFDEPHLLNGTIYAVADQPEGPFRQLDDFVLMASACRVYSISCRSLMFEGRRYVMYTNRAAVDGTDSGPVMFGTLSTPKELAVRDGRLVMLYSDRIESHVGEERIGVRCPARIRESAKPYGQIWPLASARWQQGEIIRGGSRTGWSIAELGVEAENFIFEADVTMQSGVAAGVAIRMKDNCAVFVGIDRELQSVVFSDLPVAEFVERRRCVVQNDQTWRLRIVQHQGIVEVYIDDEMKLTFRRYLRQRGEVGLFVDRAEATFANVRLRTLID